MNEEENGRNEKDNGMNEKDNEMNEKDNKGIKWIMERMNKSIYLE